MKDSAAGEITGRGRTQCTHVITVASRVTRTVTVQWRRALIAVYKGRSNTSVH